MVMFWSVKLFLGVYEWVHFYTHSEGIAVGVTLRMWSSIMIGLVCALGGRFLINLVIFFCALISGWMYVLLLSLVPQTAVLRMRWG